MGGGDRPPGPATTFREHLERVEGGDISQVTAAYAKDGVLDVDPTGEQGHPHAGTFRGRDEIGEWIDNWLSSFDSYGFEVCPTRSRARFPAQP